MKKIYLSTCLLITTQAIVNAQEQPDTTKSININEVVISANKVEETKRTVPQQMQSLNAKEIENAQAMSTAELIQSAGIHVQKSQFGGGSPVLRGFEASRIGLYIDGVRLNNLIFRAGHLQDVIKTDNNSFERVEILYGPSSTIYGSDALGGVIHMYTIKPSLATGEQNSIIKANAFSRYQSAAQAMTGHLDFNYGTKKFASLTSFSYSKFDDLMSGKNQNPLSETAYGERTYYVEHIGIVDDAAKDTLIKNSNRYLQVGSAYSQYDIMQKFLYQQNEKLSHGLNVQYSNNPDDVPRYDRLTDPSASTGLASAEWYYGPQERLLAAYDMNIKNPSKLNIHAGVNYQMLQESRHNRNFGSRYITHRIEDVSVIGANLDFQKITAKHNVRFGFDGQLNTVKSTAERRNIVLDTGSVGNWDTRYFNGDNTMNNFAVYVSHTWIVNDQITITDGLRGGYSMLKSTIDDTVHIPGTLPAALPYTTIEQNTPVYSGSVGVIHSPTDDLKVSLLLSTGFRVPNVDDLTKIFEPPSGGVIVPNEDLKPEKTINYELGITKIINNKTRWENAFYYTTFRDVAVVDSFQFNGQDSIMYDGVMSQVYAMQNKNRAYIYGFSSNLVSRLSDHFRFSVGINYTYGRVQTDTSNSPLDHIPPLGARASFAYDNGKFFSEFFVLYSDKKQLKDYGGGEDNLQYATPDGMPAWYTLNLHLSYKLNKFLTVKAGVDNIFDTQYRTFASGINAPGRNVFGALRFHY
ncbi:MAG: TonB-dependent receptor [Bacteroidia bacterium]